MSIPLCRKGRLEHVWRASCHRREEKLAPYRKSRLSSQVQQREGHPPATASVLFAHELGLVPITTSAYSPQSNGLAEAFVGRFKRDYISGADAESVLAQLGGWFEDYNTHAPHAALAMRSPAEYRAETTLSSSR